jgi:hypothetical protein
MLFRLRRVGPWHCRVPESQRGRVPLTILVVLLFSGASLAFA